jgi:hypothetical protein
MTLVWIPIFSFASGLYAIIISVSVIMYKNLGINNEDIIYTSLLPSWVIKPLWSPFIDLYSTKENGFSDAINYRSCIFNCWLTIPLNHFFVISFILVAALPLLQTMWPVMVLFNRFRKDQQSWASKYILPIVYA